MSENYEEETSTSPADLQTTIIANLIRSDSFCRKALPHIKPKYFEGAHKIVYELALEFISKYNKLPNATILEIEFQNSQHYGEKESVYVESIIKSAGSDSLKTDEAWMLDATEKWCKERAVYLAIMESIGIIDGKGTDGNAEGSIPKILSDALSVSFDTNVGHDYLKNAEERFDHYHRVEDKIPFDLEMMNNITKGGVPRKTLNVILAGCVHPKTLIKIRIRCKTVNPEFTEHEISIGDVEYLLDHGYEVEVTSPDGWVPVIDFIDKGDYDEYALEIDGVNVVRCNAKHLFETRSGWVFAEDLIKDNHAEFLLDSGKFVHGQVYKTGEIIPIVDITVDHENHRYYTNGVSSHNTAVGKSLAMCHFATAYLAQGKNILYITLEMSEEKIAERLDFNLFDMVHDDITGMSKAAFCSKVKNIADKTHGNLVIKEYPTAAAHAGHFRALIQELKLKKNFVPDVIFIDYLNICASSRIKGLGGSVNSYTLIKSIAEELRGLAVEFDLPIWTATQVTRSGFDNSDISITDTSECIAISESVTLRDGTSKLVNHIRLGDQILSNDEYKTVMFRHHNKIKDCVKITTSSGKSIIVSKDHIFPSKTLSGIKRISIKDGLRVGDILSSVVGTTVSINTAND